MKRLFKSLCALAAVVCAASNAGAQSPAARFTVQEMLKIQRVSEPQLSPDGRWVAYQIGVPDVAANRSRTQIYLISVSGGEPKQLTNGTSRPSFLFSSHSAVRFTNARSDLGDWPATYNRRYQISSSATAAGSS